MKNTFKLGLAVFAILLIGAVSAFAGGGDEPGIRDYLANGAVKNGTAYISQDGRGWYIKNLDKKQIYPVFGNEYFEEPLMTEETFFGFKYRTSSGIHSINLDAIYDYVEAIEDYTISKIVFYEFDENDNRIEELECTPAKKIPPKSKKTYNKSVEPVLAKIRAEAYLYQKSIFEWIDEENYDAVKLLLKKGADLYQKNEYGTPLIEKLLFIDDKEIIELTVNGANIQKKNNYGETLLMQMAMHGKSEIVEMLLAKGAKVDEKDNEGRTALHFASTPEVALMLLEKGADASVKDNSGRTPSEDALYSQNFDVSRALENPKTALPKCRGYALFSAIRKHDKAKVQKLINDGADLTVEYAGDTLLDRAQEYGDEEIIKIIENAMKK